jgi:hypothetical protein
MNTNGTNSNTQRVNEGGPDAIRPDETIPGMTSEQIQAELFSILEGMGVSVPAGFSAVRNEHIRDIMSSLTPFKADGNPLSANRTRMNRVLVLMLELRARCMGRLD